MNRRGFLGVILAAKFAPAAIGSGVLMPVRALWTPDLILWGDGIHDDTVALQAWADGHRVLDGKGQVRSRMITRESFITSETIYLGGLLGVDASISDSIFIAKPWREVGIRFRSHE